MGALIDGADAIAVDLGGEAFDLLPALNTGHSGSLSTIHANCAPTSHHQAHEQRSPRLCRTSARRQPTQPLTTTIRREVGSKRCPNSRNKHSYRTCGK
jgi:Flp pilus assembly CpaF family ATPase